ncbi:MAG: DNA-binding protein WhiA [Bacilli bacterium]|jgi:DNA-binding protein WhiA|nr:DNA-binding protein WhiA [Bacilli bacterium]
MSFTGNIKNEISNIEYSDSEKMAELSAILNIGIKLYEDKFEIYTENISVARRIYKLIKEIYHIEINMDTSGKNTLRNNKLVLLSINEKMDLILSDLSILENEERVYIPKDYLVDELNDKQAYLRGVFMMCGSINDPKTSRYHAEFVIQSEETANYVNDLLNEMSFKSKVIKRDKNYMVYIKEAEKISDFIRMLNATTSLFYYEDIRIYRDHKNMTNRLNNCEQANVDKSINASQEQLEDIKALKEKFDFDLLDEKIKEICIYKEKYPESSMGELAEIISAETEKPISKSGINHRFRKIKEMLKQ